MMHLDAQKLIKSLRYHLSDNMIVQRTTGFILSRKLSAELWKRVLSSSSDRQRLVILGTGWGSYSVLKKIDKKLYDVTVVSPRNHFLFTPLLCGTTVGTLEFRSVIEPIRNAGFRQTDHFHLSRAAGLDLKNQVLHVQSVVKPDSMYDLSYDKLVIGVGSLSNTFNTPGVTEHAFFLKEVADARNIRNKILSNFELSTQPSSNPEESRRLLHIVIVGGGPTGVEFGAELYDFIEQDVTRLFRAKKGDVKVTLIESNQILSSFDAKLRKYAEKKIQEREGFTLIRDIVTEVHEDHIKLASGEQMPCGMVVWSAGLAPRDFVRDLDAPKNNGAQILTDLYLNILGDPSGNSFALGDCAAIKDYTLPCSAQVATKQGKYLAKQLNKGKNDVFTFTNSGKMAYIGCHDGLTDMPRTKFRVFETFVKGIVEETNMEEMLSSFLQVGLSGSSKVTRRNVNFSSDYVGHNIVLSLLQSH